MDGTARPELDPRQLLNPRIYGQKEIFGIAQNETARLEMIDGFAEVDLRDATGRERIARGLGDEAAGLGEEARALAGNAEVGQIDEQ